MIRIGRLEKWVPFTGIQGAVQNFPVELEFLCQRESVLIISKGDNLLEVPLPVGNETVSFTLMKGMTVSAHSLDGGDGGIMVYNPEPGLLQSRDLPSMVEFAEHRMGALLTDEQIAERRSRQIIAAAGKRAANLEQQLARLGAAVEALTAAKAASDAALAAAEAKAGVEAGNDDPVS